MNKGVLVLTFTAAMLLTGCEKIQQIMGMGDRIKEKLSWKLIEEADKLNNTKILKVRKDFEFKENDLQISLEFQCPKKKNINLVIEGYGLRAKEGRQPGVDFKFESDNIVRTRSGDQKIALYAKQEREFSNVVAMEVNGYSSDSMTGILYRRNMLATHVLGDYKVPFEVGELQKLLKSSPWIIEVPTTSGKGVVEVDFTNKNLQKFFETCEWMPQVLAPSQADQKGQAASQPNSDSKPQSSKATDSAEKSYAGQLLEVNMGDTGCSLKILETKTKKKIELYAINQVCDLTPDNTYYRFISTMTEIPDCGGAENCKKSKKVEAIYETEPM